MIYLKRFLYVLIVLTYRAITLPISVVLSAILFFPSLIVGYVVTGDSMDGPSVLCDGYDVIRNFIYKFEPEK